MLTHMRTSIDVPDALLEKARKVMQRRGVTLRELMVAGLRHAIAESQHPSAYELPDLSFKGEQGFVAGVTEESVPGFVRDMNEEWRKG